MNNKKEKILLLGMGGHAKSIVDTIETCNDYEIAGFIDKTDKKVGYRNYPVLGTDIELESLYQKGIKNICICIGFMGKGKIRNQLYSKLKKIGYRFPQIIDNTSIKGRDIILEEGVFVGKGAILNAEVKVEKMAIVNSGTIIEHESKIGAFSHIAVGTVICGNCTIGANTLIGANSTIIQQITVGDNVIIGAGSVLTKNIESNKIAYGNPCRKVGNNDE